MINMALKDLQITFGISPDNPFTYDLKYSGGKLEGKNNLIQRIAKKILTAKESHVFHPDHGSGFYSLIGTVGSSDIERVKEVIPNLIDDLVSQIKEEQRELEMEGKTLSDSEYLTGIELYNVEYDELFSGWIIKLLVKTRANEKILLRIP